MKCGENITFQEFLERLQINEEDYIMAESLSLTRNTVFLEQTPLEIRINIIITILIC